MLLKRSVRRRLRGEGFTLIELLVVVTIIIFLIAMLAKVFLGARSRALEATAGQTINNITLALKAYYGDTDFYPGFKDKPGVDSAPKLYEALCGRRLVDGGGGGPNGPYFEASGKEIGVDTGQGIWRKARDDELEDPSVDKVFLDPWGRPYHFVENDSKHEKTAKMHNKYTFDMWSDGHNLRDDGGEEDDVKNWND